MGYEPTHNTFAPLPRNLRPTVTQVFVADLFATDNNDNIEEHASYFGFCRATRAWHVCEDIYNTQWLHPTWSYAEERDVVPLLYKRVIKIVRQLTELSTPADQRRCLSHSFIAGVVRLLQCDERTIIEPWELRGNHPPKPIRLELEAEREAERRAERQKRLEASK